MFTPFSHVAVVVGMLLSYDLILVYLYDSQSPRLEVGLLMQRGKLSYLIVLLATLYILMSRTYSLVVCLALHL